MSNTFSNGYALLVGVGACKYSDWSLPVTVKDIQSLYAILTDPNLCGYINDDRHIRLLHDAAATRTAILDDLNWLKEQATADSEATVVVYYSGHGWLDKSTDKYYLIAHDTTPNIPKSALSAEAFTEALRQIQAKRLLVIIDSCHAEGMATAKDELENLELPPSFAPTPPPKSLVNQLNIGQGRAVFTSCQGRQKSWIRKDEAMSIYTYHLIEALQGAGNQPGDTVVKVSNLMNYVSKAVPESVQREYQREQIPFFDFATGDFSVAVLRGGKGLPKAGWEAVQEEATETIGRGVAGRDAAIASGNQTVNQPGSGNINFGNIGQAGDITLGSTTQANG